MKKHIGRYLTLCILLSGVSRSEFCTAQTKDISAVKESSQAIYMKSGEKARHTKKNSSQYSPLTSLSTRKDFPTPDSINARMARFAERYNVGDTTMLYSLAYQNIDFSRLDKVDALLKGISRIRPVEQSGDPSVSALWYDVIATGEVEKIQHDSQASSCYHTIYSIRIDSCEKPCGKLKGNTIKIFEESGPLTGGVYLQSSYSLDFKLHEKYYFLLSNSSVKRFSDVNDCSASYDPNVFIASRRSIPTSDPAYVKLRDGMKPVLSILNGKQ